MTQQPARTVVVQAGSSSLTSADGALSSRALDTIVEQLAALSGCGVGALLVTSGAISTGRAAVG